MTDTTAKIDAIQTLTNDGQYPIEEMDAQDLDHEAMRDTGWTLHEPTSQERPDYYEHESGIRLVIRDAREDARVPRVENGPQIVYDHDTVWGVGDTEDEAVQHAAEWLPDERGEQGTSPEHVRKMVDADPVQDALRVSEAGWELARRVLDGEPDLARERDDRGRQVLSGDS